MIRSTERQLDTLDTNTLKELSVSITVATDGSVTHFSVNQHVSGFKGAKGTECTGSGGFKGEQTRLSRWLKLKRNIKTERLSAEARLYLQVEKINGVIGRAMQRGRGTLDFVKTEKEV